MYRMKLVVATALAVALPGLAPGSDLSRFKCTGSYRNNQGPIPLAAQRVGIGKELGLAFFAQSGTKAATLEIFSMEGTTFHLSQTGVSYQILRLPELSNAMVYSTSPASAAQPVSYFLTVSPDDSGSLELKVKIDSPVPQEHRSFVYDLVCS
jgi:hypothetical protein